MKWIDIPPAWLFACMILAYWLPGGVPKLSLVGGAIVLVGLALMVLAIIEMRRHRTTPIPHMQPDALVSSGIFAFSRNPIYLGDLIVLFGVSLRWGSVIGILLIPVLFWILQKRFIEAEEARLRAHFGSKFDSYCSKTRRWL